ncbi:MAG: hypothetical protein Q3M30_11655 [Candidatus Electrothrix sp. Rat3]|nr:hypothetical protein [Candidatus Electrothrix rattekaaiensis]
MTKFRHPAGVIHPAYHPDLNLSGHSISYKTLQPAKNKSEHHITHQKTGSTIIAHSAMYNFLHSLYSFFYTKKFFSAFLSSTHPDKKPFHTKWYLKNITFFQVIINNIYLPERSYFGKEKFSFKLTA